MLFTVPLLSTTTAPHLRVTIKNDDGTGNPIAGLLLAVGDIYSSSGTVGVTGYRAHGTYAVNNTTYSVLDITLNTSFIGTNTIQFRGIVGTTGTAGLYITNIEVVNP
jgi:hypothetical protein